MKGLKFDFSGMFSFNVGREHGVNQGELKRMSREATAAHRHLTTVIANPANRITLGLEWTQLPFQDRGTVEEIQALGDQIARKYRNVVFLGIGGSQLGLRAAQDALCPPYHNEFSPLRNGRPRVYFEGNSLDPDPMRTLLANLNPRQTFVVVISKSGETTETKVAFRTISSWLRSGVGDRYGRQVVAITDPESGTLRNLVNKEQELDSLSYRSLPLLRGVGGRYSELNMGLLHLGIVGVKVDEVLSGARAMAERCAAESPDENPACMYAALQTILQRNHGKSIAIMIPFSEALCSTADWYAQLLGESLGKKFGRKIVVRRDGLEKWVHDRGRVVNVGRTPVAARGTADLHSIHQNNVEGENNKTITFIRVERFQEDIKIPGQGDFLAGKSYSEIMGLAQEATEWALIKEKRPNCTITMPEITPHTWGQLIFFFEMATAFEGELLGVNAFDQPGVESYKNYVYHKLRKPGLSKRVGDEIRKHPVRRRKEYIL